MNLAEANKKFIAGPGITDDELELLITQYQQVVDFFEAVKESQFELFENTIRWRLLALKNYKKIRTLKEFTHQSVS